MITMTFKAREKKRKTAIKTALNYLLFLIKLTTFKSIIKRRREYCLYEVTVFTFTVTKREKRL